MSIHFENQCYGVTHPETLTSFAPFWSELPGNLPSHGTALLHLLFTFPALKEGWGKKLVEGITLLAPSMVTRHWLHFILGETTGGKDRPKTLIKIPHNIMTKKLR